MARRLTEQAGTAKLARLGVPLRHSLAGHDDFRRTLAERPGDITPPLVYADWLDDHGHPLADLIRHSAHLSDDDLNREVYSPANYVFRTMKSVHVADGTNYTLHRRGDGGYMVSAFVRDPCQEHYAYPPASHSFHKPMDAAGVRDFFGRLDGGAGLPAAEAYLGEHEGGVPSRMGRAAARLALLRATVPGGAR